MGFLGSLLSTMRSLLICLFLLQSPLTSAFMRYYVPAQGPSLTLPQLAINNAQRMQIQPQGFVLPLTTYSGAPVEAFSGAFPPVSLSYYPTLDYRNPRLLPVPQISYPSLLYPAMASAPMETPSLPPGMVAVSPTGGSTGNLPIFGAIPLQQLSKIPFQSAQMIPIPLEEPRIPIQSAIPISLQEPRIPIQSAPAIPIPLQEPRIPLPAPAFPQMTTYLQPQLNNSIPVASFPVVVNPKREEFTTSQSNANFDTTPTTSSVTNGKTSLIPSWQYLTQISTTTPTPSTFLPPTTRFPMHSAIGQFQDATTEPPRFTFTFRPVTTTLSPIGAPKMSTFPLRVNVETEKSSQKIVPQDQIFHFNLTSLAPISTTSRTPMNPFFEKLFMKKYNVGEKLKPNFASQPLFQTIAPKVDGPLKIGAQWADRLQGKSFIFPKQFNFFNTRTFRFELPEYENPVHKSIGLAN